MVEIVKLKCPFKGTVRGYFDSVEAAVAAVDDLGDLGEEGTYITLNPVTPDLLARANNRFEERSATRAADADVVYRLWLPIDIDPVRPAGISSTEAELQAAKDRRTDVVSWLISEFGFPEPVMLMSGNGAHALFPIEEPNDADTAALIKNLLTALDARFSDDKVKVDTTVHNAARIWTVPGSTKRKGEDMPERPHRLAVIESLCDSQVSRQQLGVVAAIGAPKRGRPRKTGGLPLRSRNRGGEILDMQAEFEERGWHISELSPGKHAVKCPWADEHSSDSGITQTVIYEPEEEGKVWGFKCHHSHCADRTIKDVWMLFRPEEEAPEVEQAADERVAVTDFAYVAPEDKFLCLPTRMLWVRTAVDTRLYKKASDEIARLCSVEQMSWMPGQPMFIDDTIVSEGGVTKHPGYRVANLYRAPDRPEAGDPSDISLWLEHLTKIYPQTFEHIINWCAHRIQRPHEKLNHALVLGGKQGIGKDSILEPLKVGVGPWNFSEISPSKLTGEFTGYLQSIVLRISEARDTGDANRYELYERSKTITTGPPDTLRVNEKHTKEYHIPNVVGVIFTTNHRDGLWLPPDDRRHHVSFCDDFVKEDFTPGYWEALWNWYRAGGLANVITFLEQRDLSKFDAKNPPPKTEAWHEMVTNGCTPEEAELSEIIERLGRPEVVRLNDVTAVAPKDTQSWLNERKNRRRIPHLFEGAGYRAVRSSYAKDGRWVIGGERFVIYAQEALGEGARQRAVQEYLKKVTR